MGEGTIVVAINGEAYIINSGHQNENNIAIKMAIDAHEENIKKLNAYYQEQKLEDENGNLMRADYSIDTINVLTGHLIN